MDVYFYQMVNQVNKNILPPAELAIFEKFSTIKWPRGKEVLSHNDIHTRNFLHDGNKLYLIDWEMAGFGPEFYDVAMFANMQAMTNEDGREFLNLYLQKRASSNEYLEFVAMRQLQAMTFAIFNLLGAKQSENYELKALHKSSAPQTVRNFLFAFDSGLIDIKNPNHLYENALAQLRYANYFD
jgi:thiamine kinase-like enzyme